MKIKFKEGVTIPASGDVKELRFKEGSIHDLPDPSAYRWVRRNKAVYYVEEVFAPRLKAGRPMMDSIGGQIEKVAPQIAEAPKPKQRGRPKKGA